MPRCTPASNAARASWCVRRLRLRAPGRRNLRTDPDGQLPAEALTVKRGSQQYRRADRVYPSVFCPRSSAGGCPQMPYRGKRDTLSFQREPMSNIKRLRARAFHCQGGRCYYCGLPMWSEAPPALSEVGGVKFLTSAALRCTAEHLVAKCEGGRDQATNIVAACSFCNRGRHQRKCPLPPQDFAELVRGRLAKGKWHGFATSLPS
jgi:hypothetical protein